MYRLMMRRQRKCTFSHQSRWHSFNITAPFSISVILLMVKLLLIVDNSLVAYATPHIRNRACLEDCSDDVDCKINYQQHCPAGALRELTVNKSVATIDNFKIFKKRDDLYKYFDLEWAAPFDGSFHVLKGYQIHIQFSNRLHNDRFRPGVMLHQCYNINITDSAWIRKYQVKDSIKFHLRCIRLRLTDDVSMIFELITLPFNPRRQKKVVKTIVSPGVNLTHNRRYPAHKGWDPKLKSWADRYDQIHLLIRNPISYAKFYRVNIFLKKRYGLVFDQTLPAPSIDIKNENQSYMIVTEEDLRPHYIIPEIPKNSTAYYVQLTALDGNKTRVVKTTVVCELALNYTSNWVHHIQRWADDNDNIHVFIGNPLPLAMFYHIKLFPPHVETPVFDAISAANNYVENNLKLMKNEDTLTIVHGDEKPHYIISGFPTNKKYALEVTPLFGNKTRIPKKSALLRPVILNYSPPARLGASLGVLKTLAETKPEMDGLGDHLVTSVLVASLVIVMCLVLFVWRKFGSSSLLSGLPCRLFGQCLPNKSRWQPKNF